jgi:hypothetical protein
MLFWTRKLHHQHHRVLRCCTVLVKRIKTSFFRTFLVLIHLLKGAKFIKYYNRLVCCIFDTPLVPYVVALLPTLTERHVFNIFSVFLNYSC